MVDLTSVKHHRSVEDLAQVLCARVGKNDPSYFRLIVAYYLSQVAATMRARIRAQDIREIPVNNYMVAMAVSGYGKGKSTAFMENEVIADFRTTFRDYVLPERAEQNLWKLASKRAALNGTEDQEEYDKLATELKGCGAYPFTFDGGSEPAIKQIRQLLLLANCGAINLQIDEIGLNLEKSGEALTTYLELYDLGYIKQKLTKNSNDNKRTTEIEGATPANLMMFGTPSRVFDSGPVEKKFESLLDTGYARRSLFAYGDPSTDLDVSLTPLQIFQRRTDKTNEQAVQLWRQHLASLADPSKLDWVIDVPEDVSIALIEYELECKSRAKAMPEHNMIQRHEMEHRYFKALKLAGTFAFIEESLMMTKDQLYAAIKLVEESGNAFNKIMKREASYMKLARYIAGEQKELTHADLDELAFFRGSQRDRQDMLTMATAWGYKQHIVIKKSFIDGIEFISGDTLKETNLSEIMISHSDHYAYRYSPELAPFDQLHQLTQMTDMHWASHAFEDNHRNEENVIPGFNMIVLDVDGTAPLDIVHDLMSDYTFMTYTTKRHAPDAHRFRLLLPMNYHLELDRDDYAEFMQNVMNWLPFEVDKSANQRSRKWATFAGKFHYNKETEATQNLIDVLPFVPKTSKNEQHNQQLAELGSLDALERWFAQRFAEGDRNNQMIKFALALVDSGMSYKEVEDRVIAFNSKIKNGLSQSELKSTVLVTAAKRAQKRQTP